jgi:hypothetical protein
MRELKLSAQIVRISPNFRQASKGFEVFTAHERWDDLREAGLK